MWNRSLKHFVNDLKTSLFVIEWSAQKVPRLPELQEMDDKQLNESLSLFYTKLQVNRAKNTASRR